ncbi:MAG: DUF1330 domain-containing protein [Burkholderiales bacterium]|nr:DUF1330 domain-containing protein [Burkholderiales bacterium]
MPAPPPPPAATAFPVPAPGAPSAVPPPRPAPALTSPAPGSPALPAGAWREWTDQPVFSIVRVQIRDERAFGDYLAGHLPTIGAFGGRFLAAGAMPQPVEGEWPMRRMIVHQWPSAQVFFQWYEGSPYAPWRQLRQRAAETEMVLVQGIASSAPAATVPPALVILDVAVRDDAAFARQVQGHLPGLRAAGGEVLAAGGHFQVIEGQQWQPRRIELQRWPSATAFRGWYDSLAYRPWRDLRWSASQADMALLEGLSEAQKSERRMP